MSEKKGRIKEFILSLSMISEGRKLQGWYGRIFRLLCILYATFYLYLAGPPFLGLVPTGWKRGLFMLLTTVLVMMKFPASKRSPRHRPSLLDGIFIVATIVVFGYWIREFIPIIQRMGAPTQLDIFFGLVAVIVSLEITRRVFGVVLMSVGLFFLAFAYFGPEIPAPFTHGGFSIAQMASYSFTMEGIFGTVLDITASYVVLFVIFSGLLAALGADSFFVEFPFALTAGLRGGPAKTAVVASGMFGMISGSATANTAATGAFTIPLMIRSGYKRHVAGAIEPAASTGGMFMPPVMGAGAFLMAELLGVPYTQIVRVGLVPAIIYFFSVGVIAHLEAKRQDIPLIPRDQRADPWKLFKQGWYFLFPVLLLLVLLFLGYSATLSVYATILCMIVIAGIWKVFVENPQDKAGAAKQFASRLVDGLYSGGSDSLTIGAIVGTVGIILAMIFLTGVGFLFTTSIMDLTGGVVFNAVVMVCLTAYVLGMGMTVTSAYLLLAVLVVPALQRMGVDPMAAHFAIFWFSQTSNVSPPVAVAAYVGAAIAKADPWQTGFTALKYAAFLFFMPFVFIYSDILMPHGLTFAAAWAMITSFVATIPYGAAVTGQFIRRAPVWERFLFLAAAITMVIPGMITDVVGLGLLAALCIYQWRTAGSDAAQPVATARSPQLQGK